MPFVQSETVDHPAETHLTEAEDRLRRYLSAYFGSSAGFTCQKLFGDASTRHYWRIFAPAGSLIAAVYPAPFDTRELLYLDVNSLFAESELPVPKVLACSDAAGIVLQEDLGDTRVQDWFHTATPQAIEELYQRAIDLIFDIQSATSRAFGRDSIASRLAFDEEKLLWELEFFYQHFILGLAAMHPSPAEAGDAKRAFREVAGYLAGRPRVITHRDYHSRNLMLDRAGRLRLIDHQDARMGPVTYDLVSLLWDPYVSLGDEPRRALIAYAAEKLRTKCSTGFVAWCAGAMRSAGTDAPLDLMSPDYVREREMMVIQRLLKAAGTYASQKMLHGRDHYLPFIRPAATEAIAALERLNLHPGFTRLVSSATERIAIAMKP